MTETIYFRKAQAVLEIGILGSLILIAFSLLISYIQRLNDEQYTLMGNFRQALKKAHDENAIVNYTTLEDRRHIDINTPLAGQRTNLSASNYVHWSVPYVGDQQIRSFYYNINDEEISLSEDDQIGDIVFEYGTKLDKSFNRTETLSLISSVHKVDIDENLTYTLRDPDEKPIKTISQNRITSKQRGWDTSQ
ncbi:MAG: hypothetical protein ABIE75_02175 [Candidatus Omnitrophota bacterium]